MDVIKSSNGHKVRLKCLLCGENYEVQKSLYDRQGSSFCGHKCFTDLKNLRRIIESQSGLMSGSDHYARTEIDGKPSSFHRYVYQFFYGEIPEGMHVHHFDEEKKNNDILNLGLISKSDHMRLHLGKRKGSQIPTSKLKESDVIEIRRIIKAGNETQQQIADAFGINRCTVSAIKNNRIWKHLKGEDDG